MAKTWKDRPDKYTPKRKTKEGRRFESTKGRKEQKNLKNLYNNGSLENDN